VVKSFAGSIILLTNFVLYLRWLCYSGGCCLLWSSDAHHISIGHCVWDDRPGYSHYSHYGKF